MDHLSEESLNEYLDSALGPARQAEVQAHLAACPACRAQLESLRTLFASLEALPEAQLERDLSLNVVAALKDRAGVPPVIRLALSLQALAIVAILALAWPLFDIAVLDLPGRLDLPWLDVPSAPDLLGWFTVQWTAWLRVFTQLNMLPSFGRSFSLNLDPPGMLIVLTIVSASLLWLVGNGLLLRPRAGSYKRRHS